MTSKRTRMSRYTPSSEVAETLPTDDFSAEDDAPLRDILGFDDVDATPLPQIEYYDPTPADPRNFQEEKTSKEEALIKSSK